MAQSADKESKGQAATRGVQSVKVATVGNQEYVHGVIGTEAAQIERESDKGNFGTKAGQFADKDYYTDLEGKVSTNPPAQGKLLVAKGDAITPRIAAVLSSK